MRYSFLHITLLLLLAFILASCSRIRVEVKNLPLNTPAGAGLFVAGNFNNWNPGDPDYKLEFDPVSQSYFTYLPSGFGLVEFKFTRGDWNSVETDSCGAELSNRMILSDSILCGSSLYISSWKDLAPLYCNRITIVLDSVPFNTPRDASIYLTGNVNYWVLGQQAYRFYQAADGKFYLTVPRREDKLIFKINRGSWESVEADANGTDIQPRELVFGDEDTFHLAMRNWVDLPLNRRVTKTIIIRRLPALPDPGAKIYLSGSFNNWHPRDNAFMFHKLPNGSYAYTYSFTGNESAEYFKVTCGGWEKRELKSNGEEMNNRLLLKNGRDTLVVDIGLWARDPLPIAPVMPAPLNPEKVPTAPEAVAPSDPGQFPDNFALRKVIFIIDKLPDMRNPEEKVFLAGDFNGWRTDLRGFEFKDLPNGKKYFILRLNDFGEHQFKVTRGSWESEEADKNRNKLGNKVIRAGHEQDTIRLRIENWLDYLPVKKMVFCLTEVPSNTPPGSRIYLTGDFNNWVPNEEAYRFKNVNGNWILTIPDFTRNFNEFKVTRGDWSNEFAGRGGLLLNNQSFSKYLRQDTVRFKVKEWIDLPLR